MSESYIKTPEQIEKIKHSGRILGFTLNRLKEMVAPGISLLELEDAARNIIEEHGAKPAFLGYKPYGAEEPFPFALCASVNDVIVHGRPSSYVLKSGDLVSLDLGVNWKGGISDAAFTVGVGKISKKDAALISLTKEALEAGIKAVKAGNTTGDIGYAISQKITSGRAKIVEHLTGHGVGNSVHEDPAIYNYGEPGSGETLEEGMVIAIEPMASFNSGYIRQLPDDSYATMDGSNSAHFEQTVLIKKNSGEILTRG